jgi:hypothetical protein
MSRLQAALTLLLLSCGAVPILIGASCPPPTNPPLFNVIPDNDGLTDIQIPACVQGFVCVNLANGATIPVVMSLYTHNGFDPNDQFADPPQFSCCTNPNSQVACPCPCPGRDTGNCRLDRIEIFQLNNLRPVSNLQQVPLAPNQSILQRVRCEDVKTLGAAVAKVDGNSVVAPEDAAGPIYRDEPGGVLCGQTVQFLATDLNETGSGTGGDQGDLATLIIRTQFSR